MQYLQAMNGCSDCNNPIRLYCLTVPDTTLIFHIVDTTDTYLKRTKVVMVDCDDRKSGNGRLRQSENAGLESIPLGAAEHMQEMFSFALK